MGHNQDKKTRFSPFILFATCLAALLFLFACKQNKVTEVDLGEISTKKSKAVQTNEDKPVLRIAVGAMISPKPTRQYYNDLLELIGKRLGYSTFFAQKKTYAEVNDLVEQQEVDLAFVCSGPYVTGQKKFGMELLAVPVAHGEKVYYSYILAHRDSPIQSLEDMRGKKFAFTDPHSNTGCLVPRYMLATRGEKPDTFFKELFYTYSHDNSIKAVAEGVGDGAAVDHLIWEFMNNVDPTYTAQTKIVQKSPPYGIPPVVVHPNIDPELKQRLKQLFFTLHKDEQAQPILRQLQIDRFEEGEDSMYDTVRVMEEWFEKNNI